MKAALTALCFLYYLFVLFPLKSATMMGVTDFRAAILNSSAVIELIIAAVFLTAPVGVRFNPRCIKMGVGIQACSACLCMVGQQLLQRHLGWDVSYEMEIGGAATLSIELMLLALIIWSGSSRNALVLEEMDELTKVRDYDVNVNEFLSHTPANFRATNADEKVGLLYI